MQAANIKNTLLSQTRTLMSETINRLTYENLPETEETIQNAFSLLKDVSGANLFRNAPKNELRAQPDALCPNKDEPNESDTASMPRAEAGTHSNAASEPSAHTFSRRLRGGVLDEPGIFVPEQVVRKLNLKTGDRVKATPKTNGYYFSLVSRDDEVASDGREEYRLCPVEKDGFIYTVSESIDRGLITTGEAPYLVHISESDRLRFQIEEGDLVDIAFYADNPGDVKVTWKWPTEVDSNLSNAPKTGKKRKHASKTELPQTLVGKTILVVCDDANQDRYRESIEDRGGTFLWASNMVTVDASLESKVKNADKVILILDDLKHARMHETKDLCKKTSTPYEMIWGRGRENLVRVAEEITEANEKEAN